MQRRRTECAETFRSSFSSKPTLAVYLFLALFRKSTNLCFIIFIGSNSIHYSNKEQTGISQLSHVLSSNFIVFGAVSRLGPNTPKFTVYARSPRRRECLFRLAITRTSKTKRSLHLRATAALTVRGPEMAEDNGRIWVNCGRLRSQEVLFFFIVHNSWEMRRRLGRYFGKACFGHFKVNILVINTELFRCTYLTLFP
jgi:hypothetical protein